MRRVAVLDYGMGNLRSVAKALEAAGVRATITSDQAAIAGSDGLCVPGQGIFGRCMTNLRRAGMDEVLREWIAQQRPYLGICLGMQVLFDRSEESGSRDGLGILNGTVTRLPDVVRVPHIGWNVVVSNDSGEDGAHYYFDHSYAVHPADETIVAGWCSHGDRFAAWVEKDSVTAVQFHPEKSSRKGIALLSEWVMQ